METKTDPSNKENNSRIDVVIPYHSKDCDIIELCLAGGVKNIQGLGSIYVIAAADKADLKFEGVQIIDEDKLFAEGLTKKYIQSKWGREHPELVGRAGWLFQQFVKMGCAYAIPNLSDYYLLVDADLVFLRKINFFRDGRVVLTKGKEFHMPYFECYERLIGEPANRECSFVAHHMLISKTVMLELLDKIECRFNKKWYDAILDNLDYEENSPFSEYETYGHYLKNHYGEITVVAERMWSQRLNLHSMLSALFNRMDYCALHSYKKKGHDLMFSLIGTVVAAKVKPRRSSRVSLKP